MSGANEMHKQPTAEECRGVFRALFEQTSVGVAQVASKTGAFVRINERFAEIFGYTVADMEPLTLQQITYPEDLLEEQANIQRLLAGEIRGFSIANRYYHNDGRTVWGELTVSPMWDVGEEPSFHIAMIEDITRRKLAEEARQQREQMYRALVEGLPDIVLQYDRQGRHLFVSENVEEVVDFPASQFLGKTTRELGFPEELCEFWDKVIERVFESGLPYETEFAFESKTGPQTRNWRLEPEFNEHGRVRSVLSISRDVTEYRRAEKDYKTLFREMLNGFALHEIICNEQGEPVDYRFLAVNPAFERLTGLKSENLVGKTVLEVMPSTERHWIELYGRVALEGEPERFDNYSHELEKHYTVTAFQPSPGQFACIFDDITDRKRAEHERDELITMLEAQNAELERFTYTVSHDLKSPLITIKGYIGMLFEDLYEMDGAAVKSDLLRVSNAAEKMGNLLDDLLELSRIGRLTNPPEKVSLANLAEDALELLQGPINSKRVSVKIAPDLPVVHGDRIRLLEVLQNLIDNAVKYMGAEAEPRIEIGTRRDADETVCFVRDNGIGIEERFQEKVFGLFDQLDPKVEGTGIGLALAKRIIEVHGGRLWVESDGKGLGSTFCFTIPAGAPPDN